MSDLKDADWVEAFARRYVRGTEEAARASRLVERLRRDKTEIERLRDALIFARPALAVLRNMCQRAGLKAGAAKAEEINQHIRSVLEGALPSNGIAERVARVVRDWSEGYCNSLEWDAELRPLADAICAEVMFQDVRCSAETASELLALVKDAQATVCSAECPVTWKTGETQPHSDRCRMMKATIAKAEGRIS